MGTHQDPELLTLKEARDRFGLSERRAAELPRTLLGKRPYVNVKDAQEALQTLTPRCRAAALVRQERWTRSRGTVIAYVL